MPARLSRSVYRMDRYWAVSTVRRNSLNPIHFQQPLQSLRQRLPAECLAWSGVQRMDDGVQFFRTVSTKVCSLWKVLAEKTIGVFVAAALPRALRVAEIDVETGVDPELGMLGHLGALVPGQGSAQVRR